MGRLSGRLSTGIELASDSLAVRVLNLSGVDEFIVTDLVGDHGYDQNR